MGEISRSKNKFRKEGNLLAPEVGEQLIFVGDIHGDYEACREVIDNYLKPENTLVFLGDYVDKGRDSKKTIDFLLEEKVDNLSGTGPT